MLLAAARRTPLVLPEPAPFVMQKRLNPDSTVYELNVYVRDASQSAHIYSELHQNIQEVFAEAGVPLHASIPMHETALPRSAEEDYLPQTTVTRHFHVFPPLRRLVRREQADPPTKEDLPE